MAVLLAHGDHSMFTCWNCLLANRPVASHIAWIHPRIIGTLQSTFVTITLFKLSCAISSWWDSTEIKQIRWRSISHDSFTLAQEFVSNAELKRNFLLNCWQVKYLMWFRRSLGIKINSVKVFVGLIYLNRCCDCWSFTKILLNTARSPTPGAARERSTQLT